MSRVKRSIGPFWLYSRKEPFHVYTPECLIHLIKGIISWNDMIIYTCIINDVSWSKEGCESCWRSDGCLRPKNFLLLKKLYLKDVEALKPYFTNAINVFAQLLVLSHCILLCQSREDLSSGIVLVKEKQNIFKQNEDNLKFWYWHWMERFEYTDYAFSVAQRLILSNRHFNSREVLAKGIIYALSIPLPLIPSDHLLWHLEYSAINQMQVQQKIYKDMNSALKRLLQCTTRMLSDSLIRSTCMEIAIDPHFQDLMYETLNVSKNHCYKFFQKISENPENILTIVKKWANGKNVYS